MSNEIFPTLPGTKIDVRRTVTWSTKVMKARSGREQRISYQEVPIYEYELTIEVLRQGTINGKDYNELKLLVDFYNARKGAFDNFQFKDPYDNALRTVRFKDDKLDTARIMSNLWEAKKVSLIEVI